MNALQIHTWIDLHIIIINYHLFINKLSLPPKDV